MLLVIPIIEVKKEFYIEINYLNKDIIETNHALLQTPKQKLAKIF